MNTNPTCNSPLKAMFRLCLIAFALARKQYRIGLLFTYNKGDFGAISVTEPAKLCRADL